MIQVFYTLLRFIRTFRCKHKQPSTEEKKVVKKEEQCDDDEEDWYQIDIGVKGRVL